MHSPAPAPEPQSAGAVLMVQPVRFDYNAETAASNAFQAPVAAAQTADLALREFHRLAEQLARAGIRVHVGADTQSPVKPDAIFPNNWVSFHADGTVVLYPMLAVNRRAERREDLVHQVLREGGYGTSRTVDLSHREGESKFLEGTGSLVLDRAHRVAYAALSPRTDLDVLGEFAQQLDYELVTFGTCDATGQAVYHTNVLMAIGTHFAVLCAEVITDLAHRAAVLEKLRGHGHEVVEISAAQMKRFAGNILELATGSGNFIAMSTTAWNSFEPGQRRRIERQGSILAADIPVIERVGGGGVRCMLAEIHLPRR